MPILLQSPTPDLQLSRDFYTSLEFRKVSENPLMLTDGKVLLQINPDRHSRAGIIYYKDSWEKEIEVLGKITKVHNIEKGYLLADPSAVWIYLMEGNPDFEWNPQKESFSKLGNYAGLSLETVDFNRSTAIYEALGFKAMEGTVEKGYVTFVNQKFVVTLMPPLCCPHLFFNPSMTYFNGKSNFQIIRNLLKLDIHITEEITHFNKNGMVDNIIIRDPGGFGFFIFSD